MNEQILIVEDRLNRIEQWLGKETTEDLKNAVVVMSTLPGIGNGQYDFHNLDEYRLVAIHRSYMDDDMQTRLYDYIEQSSNFFIIFSGGITQETILYGGHLANLPIQRLYTDDIVDRLNRFDFTEQALVKFLYGDNWKLPFLQRLRILKWLYPDDAEMIREKEPLQKILGNPGNIDQEIHTIYYNY